MIILLALFVLVFFTKTAFSDLQQTIDLQNQKTIKLESNETELKRLNAIQKEFNDNTSDAVNEITKFTKSFDDQAIINHIYDYVAKINANGTAIALRSVSFSESKEGDLGFKEANINVTARFGSEQVLLDMLKYFINSDANYTFFINSLSLPNI